MGIFHFCFCVFYLHLSSHEQVPVDFGISLFKTIKSSKTKLKATTVTFKFLLRRDEDII